MRALTFVVLAVAAGGCSGNANASNALIASGAVVAVVASEAATKSSCLPRYNDAVCSGSTGNKRAEAAAAAGVAAGVMLAAAGEAMRRHPPTDSPHYATPTHPTATWQLGARSDVEQAEAEEQAEKETEAPKEGQY